MEYTVSKLAELSGVTARTLRWYDRIGLLKPGRTTEAGYRLYGPGEVDRLQQILFYRELGLELADIRAILDDPAFDRQGALQSHLAALEDRRTRLDALILTVRHTIDETKEGHMMSDKQKFEAFKQNVVEQNEAKYGAEIREKYGDETVGSANAAVLNLSETEYLTWTTLGAQIQTNLEQAVRAGADPAGEVGASIAALHKKWLSYSWEKYTPQAHRGLAEMYVADERFTAYYDKNIPGCARFLRDAVAAWVDKI